MEEENIIIKECPHCNEFIIIYKNEINCGIFRHGILKDNFQQINPHLSKNECQKLYNQNKLYGCSKPFKIIINNGIYKVEACDYI